MWFFGDFSAVVTKGTDIFTIPYRDPELKLGKWSWNSARSQKKSNLTEVAELSSFCKSTSNNSTRLQRDPAKVFSDGCEVAGCGGVSVDICRLGCGACRVWIQPTKEMIHSNMLTDVKVAHWFSLWTKPGGIFWDASYLEHDSWLWKRLHIFTLWCWPVPVPDPNDLNVFSFLPNFYSKSRINRIVLLLKIVSKGIKGL